MKKAKKTKEVVEREWRDEVRAAIDVEGFEYAFMHYSNFKNIKNAEFHRLRLAFIEAANRLQEYIGDGDDSE